MRRLCAEEAAVRIVKFETGIEGGRKVKILITGASGFVGKNLVENLKNIRDGKDRTRPDLHITSVYEYGRNNTAGELERFCSDCDFVFHFAGVNRPQNLLDFQTCNVGLAETLLDMLKKYNNTCPVVFSSSIQAALTGRYTGSLYGESKKRGEQMLFDYSRETGAKVLVYRFPNLFGKWCRPNYNSAVATFCNAVANRLPYTVDDCSTELELLYIDDLVYEMLNALENCEHSCNYEGLEPVPSDEGRYCYVPLTYKVTLGQIVDLLESFKQQPDSLLFTSIPTDSFEKKLYATYLSYLPEDKTIFDLHTNADHRGSFTEFFKTFSHGQFSINVSKPGVTKGQHWHNTKAEIFIVVSGHGLIQERRIGTDENGCRYPVREFEVSGDRLQCVYMLPGYTHNIINLSETENMVTVMWANELFDPGNPETYSENVSILDQ